MCVWMPLVNGTGHSPSPERPTPGVVKQDKSSGGSVDTTKTRSGPQRVRMSSGERPRGAAKGNQSDTEALCHPPPPPSPHDGQKIALRTECAMKAVGQARRERQRRVHTGPIADPPSLVMPPWTISGVCPRKGGLPVQGTDGPCSPLPLLCMRPDAAGRGRGRGPSGTPGCSVVGGGLANSRMGDSGGKGTKSSMAPYPCPPPPHPCPPYPHPPPRLSFPPLTSPPYHHTPPLPSPGWSHRPTTGPLDCSSHIGSRKTDLWLSGTGDYQPLAAHSGGGGGGVLNTPIIGRR